MVRLQNISTTSSSPKACRAAMVIATVLLLSGCGTTVGSGDAASLFAVIKNTWNHTNKKVALEEAAAVPYASMGIRLGDSPQTMLLLVSDSSGQRLWTSGAGVAIVTKDGHIARTAGFPHNLGGYELGRESPGKNGVQTMHWQADFPDLKLYSVSIACLDRPARDETIVILGKNINTRRVDESCTSEGRKLDWSFDNTYWLDPSSGLIWRSIQHVHPQLDAIETEILRPPF